MDNLRIDSDPEPEMDDTPDMPTGNFTTTNLTPTYPTPTDRDADTLTVPKNTQIRGGVGGMKTLVVHGYIDPEVDGLESLVVSESGHVDGNIRVSGDADIAGEIEGGLTVGGTLRIRSTGKVSGAIHYERLAIDEGGEFLGTAKRIESQGEDHESVRSDDPQHPESDVATDGNAGA